ncbi:MAG: DsbE family thiol:disulfide interchange protein [Alphaproteobacteria bacterium]|nr:DsbE family thiol:disulfide interchange protein [Alphaproteobacteria bacterium]
MMKRLPTSFIPLLLCAGLFAALAFSLLRGPSEQNKFAQHVGEKASPTTLPLLDMADTHFDTAEWIGRPYIINFFASWCVPCQAEHEVLSDLQNHLHLPVIGIAYKDRPESLHRFLNKAGNPYLAVADDKDGHTGIDWGLTGVPETFVIDAHGVIRYHLVGPMTEETVMDDLLPAWKEVSQ